MFGKRIRNIVSVVLVLAWISMLMVGCSTSAQESNSQVTENETTVISESAIDSEIISETSSDTDANLVVEEKPKDIYSYYHQQVQKSGEYMCYEYSSDFRGFLAISCFDDQPLVMEYHLEDGRFGSTVFRLKTSEYTGKFGVYIELIYDDKVLFRTEKILQSEEIDPFIKDIMTSTHKDPSDEYYKGHDIQGDVLIAYARFLTLSEQAFEKIDGDYGFQNLGLELTKAPDVDPATFMGNELPFLENEHHFVNGVCTDEDCGMTWAKYILDSIPKLDGNYNEMTGNSMIYGKDNQYVREDDYIEYVIYHIHQFDDEMPVYDENSQFISVPGMREIMVYTSVNNNAKHYTQMYSLSMNLVDSKQVSLNFSFEDSLGRSYENQGKYHTVSYQFLIYADPDDVDDVFSSKEALYNNSFFITSVSGAGELVPVVFDESSSHDEKLAFLHEQGYLDTDDYSLCSKDELVEQFFARGPRYIHAIEESLVEFGTSLKDRGIEIDNIACEV